MPYRRSANQRISKTSELIARADSDRVKFIHLQFTDLNGLLKGVTIPRTKLETALEDGVWFDGSSIEGFTRIFESDMSI